MREVKVSGCQSCVFRTQGWFCVLGDMQMEENTVLHQDCPLKKGPIEVKLEVPK